MDWVQLQIERRCETCGSAMERWVRVMRNQRRSGEVTFCPACSPQVRTHLETAEIDRPTDLVPPAS